jgi:23S rRNA (guanine745-N1)-methyltransferase
MLACPICSAPLNAVDNGVACPAGHRFDRARQGYLNLLPVQHKNSRDPGDNQAMVEARRDFLNAGHYAPVAKRLAELAADAPHAGWTSAVARVTTPRRSPRPCPTPTATPWISPARSSACKRNPALTWLIASMARVPLACQLPVSRQRVQPAGLGKKPSACSAPAAA